jgi:hypothetical protein
MEVEMSIPEDVTDIRADKERVAEVVVKLISRLKQGPLIEGKTDEQWLDGAIEFLVTNSGKAWSKSHSCTLLLVAQKIAYKTIVRSWFQPHTVENGSAPAVPTAVAGKAKAKSTAQEIAQDEGQGSLRNTSSTQHLSAPIGMMPFFQLLSGTVLALCLLERHILALHFILQLPMAVLLVWNQFIQS